MMGGRTTAWSPLYAFEVAPKVEITRPNGPTFQDPPLLEWAPVNGPLLRPVGRRTGTAAAVPPSISHNDHFQIPAALQAGNYRFWVRAINATTGRPEVQGLWSDPATFFTTGASGRDRTNRCRCQRARGSLPSLIFVQPSNGQRSTKPFATTSGLIVLRAQLDTCWRAVRQHHTRSSPIFSRATTGCG